MTNEHDAARSDLWGAASSSKREAADDTFMALGDLPGGEVASYVRDVSADGNVVVGWSRDASGDQAVRWTHAGSQHDTGKPTGWKHGGSKDDRSKDGGCKHGGCTPGETLEPHALGGPQSQAHAVSPDGALIAGSVAEPSYEQGRAGVLWRDDEPFEIFEGPRLPPPYNQLIYYFVDATVVLADGHLFGTCIQFGAYGTPLACHFDRPGHLQLFGFSHVFAVDEAGHYAGTLLAERHAPSSSVAIFDGRLPYPPDTVCRPTSGCFAEARDFSEGGAVVVGTSRIPDPGDDRQNAPVFANALVYTQAEGMARLPDLPDGEKASGAYAISKDGCLIAGFGTDENGQRAVVWVNREPRLLQDVLLEATGCRLDGWVLREVRAMSADGLTLVGNATNPDGNPEGFRVVLPSLPQAPPNATVNGTLDAGQLVDDASSQQGARCTQPPR